jgi:hypothetical protein
MKISQYLKKTIQGNQLESWNYDESMTTEELEKNGFPYAMCCSEINDNSIIAIGTGEETPFDYLNKNRTTHYVLDPTKTPRNIDCFLGNKNVFYLKKHEGEFIKNEYQWAKWMIYGFKENDITAGTILNGSYSPAMVDTAINKIQDKIYDINSNKSLYDFETKEIGSFFFQVDFLNADISKPYKAENYHKTTFKSNGFSFEEMIELIKNILKNM